MNLEPLPITILTIEEPWHTTRAAEPVRVGLPLKQGELTDHTRLALQLDGAYLPLQTRALSHWPDGSVRWAQLDFQADLDLRAPAQVFVSQSGQPERPSPAHSITIEETDDAIHLSTGPLALTIPFSGIPRLANVTVNRQPALVPEGGFSLSITEAKHGPLSFGQGVCEIPVRGPLVTEVVVHTPCYSGQDHIADIRALHRFHAGKSTVQTFLTIISLDLDLQLAQARISLMPAEEHPIETLAHTGMKLARVSDTEIHYTFASDARNSPIWYEDSPEPHWLLWRGAEAAVMASIRNADHHFPTRLAVTPSRLELDFWPRGEEQFHMYPHMAKTKEFLVEFAEPGVSGYQLTLDSALFQRPVRPVCTPQYYAETQAFANIFPTSRKYAAFESLISVSLRERTLGSGAMHFGDEPNLGYTYSQRGSGEMAWTNGEYDTPRMLFQQYARTSNRSWFEAADAAAWHWMDIDFLRDSPNTRWAGGLCCHEGDHRVQAYAGPSHEWCEGLIDFYHLTGWDEALRIAESIGDNVCRYIEDGVFDKVGAYALRELGWGLTAIAGCLRATNSDRYRQTGLRAIRILREWVDTFGGLAEVNSYGGPGRTDEVQPLRIERDAFISLTLNGINRFYMASLEPEAHDLFLAEVKAQLDWFNSPLGWAEQRETKIPNTEAFGYAYLYTGDRAYLQAGLQILDYALNNCMLRFYILDRNIRDLSKAHPSTYRYMEVSAISNQILGLAIIPMLSFMQVAEEAGVLEGLLGSAARFGA